MTAPTPQAQFVILDTAPNKEQFAVARVQMIESFVRLETEITKIILRFEPHFETGAPLVSRLAKLKAFKKVENVQLSEKAMKRFEGLAIEISKPTKIRNDLVHGIMTLVTHEGVIKAAFQNATDLAKEFPQFTLLALGDLDEGRKQLNNVANQLKQLTTPPSPPQPLLVSAAGP